MGIEWQAHLMVTVLICIVAVQAFMLRKERKEFLRVKDELIKQRNMYGDLHYQNSKRCLQIKDICTGIDAVILKLQEIQKL